MKQINLLKWSEDSSLSNRFPSGRTPKDKECQTEDRFFSFGDRANSLLNFIEQASEERPPKFELPTFEDYAVYFKSFEKTVSRLETGVALIEIIKPVRAMHDQGVQTSIVRTNPEEEPVRKRKQGGKVASVDAMPELQKVDDYQERAYYDLLFSRLFSDMQRNPGQRKSRK